MVLNRSLFIPGSPPPYPHISDSYPIHAIPPHSRLTIFNEENSMIRQLLNFCYKKIINCSFCHFFLFYCLLLSFFAHQFLLVFFSIFVNQ